MGPVVNLRALAVRPHMVSTGRRPKTKYSPTYSSSATGRDTGQVPSRLSHAAFLLGATNELATNRSR